ncbi:hypothetical protein ES319_A09G096100v1, partial [Gossypium barbadense]
ESASQPQQATAAGIDVEGQPVRVPSPSAQSQLSSQLETLRVQNHLQWQNAVIEFCFSYALGVSLQYATPLQSSHELPFPMVLLSFRVLLTFILILGGFIINSYCTTTSKALQKIALILAAAAFTHTVSIPLSLELKCAIWAVFLSSPFSLLSSSST